MAKRRLSLVLSGLLSEVKVPTDEEIVEINNDISDDVNDLAEHNENAEDLLEGISDTNEAIELIEATGLENDAGVVCVKLLANRLVKSVRKLDSNYKLELSGLQSDNASTFLADSLEEAKGILAIAKDELTKTMKVVSEKVISLDDKIEEMKKWLSSNEDADGNTDKKTETIDAIAELIDSVKETTEDVKESEAVDVEVPEEVPAAIDNITDNLAEIKKEEPVVPENKDEADDIEEEV